MTMIGRATFAVLTTGALLAGCTARTHEGPEAGGDASTTGGDQLPAPSERLTLRGPTVLAAGACSAAYTLTLVDSGGTALATTADRVITLDAGGAGELYDDSFCTVSPAANTLTLGAGSSDAQFYLRGLTEGLARLMVSSPGVGSGSLVVLIAPPTSSFHLEFTAGPASTEVGQTLGAFGVAVHDQNHTTIASASDRVTISLLTDPAGATTLGGTLTQIALNGVATFDDVTFDREGTGFVIGASAPGFAAGQSSPFDITQPMMTVDGLTLTTIATANVTATGFDVTVGFTGDQNGDRSATLHWCDRTASPACDPEMGGVAVPMTAGISDFTASVVLPPAPGADVFVRIVGSDPDGVTGSPQEVTVTLPADVAIRLSNLAVSGIQVDGFVVDVDFQGDQNNDAVATLHFCNAKDTPACGPVANGAAVPMAVAGGQLRATVSGLMPPDDPGDWFTLSVEVTDPDGVTGAPLPGWVQLVDNLCAGNEVPPLLGTGIPADPHIICSAAQLNSLAADPASMIKAYELRFDIDVTSGLVSIGDAVTPFGGTFRGNFHRIDGVEVSAAHNCQGLFNELAAGGTIENLWVGLGAGGVDGTTFDSVGAVVGCAHGGTLTNVHVEGNGAAVMGADGVGGIVGYSDNDGTTLIDVSASAVSVSAINDAGGLIGGDRGYILRGIVDGATIDAANNFAGGVTGSDVSGGGVDLEEVQVMGTTLIRSQQWAGGLTGRTYGTVQRAWVGSAVTIEARTYAGGLVGQVAGGSLTESSSSAVVNSMGAAGSFGGGIAGRLGVATVADCSYRGTLTWVGGGDIGGGIGRLDSGATAMNNYATGAVLATGTPRGGFAGTGSCAGNNLWDAATTGQPTSSCGMDRPSADLEDRQTFINLDYDFANTWRMPAAGGTPVHQWQDPIARPPVAGLFGGGDGTVSAPYQIATGDHLRDLTLAIQIADVTRQAHFALTVNVDLSGVVTPIIGRDTAPFIGVFDGGGLSITAVGLATAHRDCHGLFGSVGAGGEVRDLTIALAPVGIDGGGQTGAGGAAGCVAGGTLDAVHVNGNGAVVKGASSVGGLVGDSQDVGTVLRGSSVSDTVVEGATNTGGLIGYQSALVQSCTVMSATVAGTGNFTGGVFGQTTGPGIQDTTVDGTTLVDGPTFVGGLVGRMGGGTVTRSRVASTAAVSGTSRVGGLVGDLQTGAVVEYSHNGAPISSSAASNYGGGLAGILTGGTLRDNYSRGAVTWTGGNFAAAGVGNISSGTASRNYATGAVTATAAARGGFAANGTCDPNNVWDPATTTLATSACGLPRASAPMQARITYLNLGWDFASVWRIPAGGGYPVLQWEFPLTPPAVDTLFAGGSGTILAPYRVASPAQLSDIPYAIQLQGAARQAHYVLAGNVDFGGAPAPIIAANGGPFIGELDGGGFSISGFSLLPMGQDCVGLIGELDTGGEVHDLTVSLAAGGVDGGSNDNVGAVVGCAHGGSVTNVQVSGGGAAVNGGDSVGGVIGFSDGSGTTVTRAGVSNLSVSGSSYVGGVLGRGQGNIVTTTVQDVTAGASVNFAGGVVGLGDASTLTLADLDVLGMTDVTADVHAGGLAGRLYTSALRSSVGAGVSVNARSHAGGLIGQLSSGLLAECTSAATVNATAAGTYGGGLAGYATNSTVRDNFATGDVDWTGGDYAGAGIGRIVTATVHNNYATGQVIATGSNRGGFAGAGTCAASNTWDPVTTGQATSPCGLGRSTAELTDRQTFLNLDFDFANVWRMPAVGGPPVHQWFEPIVRPPVASLFGGGLGTPVSPYVIATAAQLRDITLAVQLDDNVRQASFTMTTPIDLAGVVAPIIGREAAPFVGVFEGGTSIISNVSHVPVGRRCHGLFGALGSGAEVRNLTVGIAPTGVDGGSDDRVGGVAGCVAGAVLNSVGVQGTGSVTGAAYVGGVVGYSADAATSVQGCSVQDINVGGATAVGGVFGGQNAVIDACTVTAVTVINALNFTGGLAGDFDGPSIAGSRVDGSTMITGAGWVGGLTGRSSAGAVSTSEVTATVAVQGSGRVGGLVGEVQTAATLQQSANRAAVSDTVAGGTYAGGIVGYLNNGTVTDCYSLGSVTWSGGNNVGGGIGDINGGTATTNYAAGAVSSTATNRGGFAGGGGCAASNLWDDVSTTLATSACGTGHPTADLTTLDTAPADGVIDTFVNAGYSAVIWLMATGAYPVLGWE